MDSSKSAGTVVRASRGVYCFSGLSDPLHNAVVSVGQVGIALGADVELSSTNCPTGTQIEVRTFDSNGVFVDNDFYININ